MRARRLRTWILRPLLVGLLLAGGFAAWMLLISDNFGVVEPGRVYRSAQLGGPSLARRLRDHRIKTVLNLRGSHPESSWYRTERAATLEAGATQVDIALSSCEWMSRSQARALLEVLDSAEKPLLIHCFHGSERTGMVAAFAELLRPGSTLADAEAQFTTRHMYFDFGDGIVTRQHLLLYNSWLRERSLAHAPDQFRRWISEGYTPGQPCRERWEFDPYPLVVVTRGLKRVADRQ